VSKFKKGDWVRESDADPGDNMRVHGYYIFAVLPNGDYVVETNPDVYIVATDGYFVDDVVEPRCTGWDWVLPEPAERFGLKIGDKVTVQNHCLYNGEYTIKAIDDDYRDGIARFELEGDAGGLWHPYWFGLCQMDGSPLPPKPETTKLYEYLVQSIQGGWYTEFHPIEGQSWTKSPGVPMRMVPTGRVFEIPKEEKP